MTTCRIATRASKLALTQARLVASALRRARPGLDTEIVEITTTGDVDRLSPVAALTEVGAFVRAVQQAVLEDRADVAVHSCKDLPVEGPAALAMVHPEREAPWDVLVGGALEGLPAGARVGTGSPRRSSQLLKLRPDVEVLEIRGNVDTRIEKVRRGEYDAVVLAEAGLARLGRTEEIDQRFSVDDMVPAPAQGALAVETRRGGDWWDTVSAIDHPATSAAIEVEREVLRRTGAGCRSALGVHAGLHDGRLRAFAFVDDDRGARRASATGPDAASVVESLIAGLELRR